ncbi:MAG: DUF2283 domain-containing protein [Pseudomonadota bacterium]
MNITYDQDVDAVYLSLKSNLPNNEVDKTYCCDVNEIGGIINLDFDKEGRLLGVEILGAKDKLPKEFMEHLAKL